MAMKNTFENIEATFRKTFATSPHQEDEGLQLSFQTSKEFAETMAMCGTMCGDDRPNPAPLDNGFLKVTLVTGLDYSQKPYGDIKGKVYSVGAWISPDLAESDLDVLAGKCIDAVVAKHTNDAFDPDLEFISVGEVK